MTSRLPLDQVVSREEMASFLKRSNLRAAWMLAFNYAVIGAAFALMIVWPNPLTVILALVLLGGRQLGLAVLNHDCAHYIFFRQRRLNELVGHWLCGGPIHISVYGYRAYHLQHHQHAGTRDDPDVALALTYPTTPSSMRRKMFRDLTGQTGIKDVRHMFRNLKWRRHLPFVVSHAAMLAILTLVGAPWAYLVWWAAFLTTYQLVTRLRFMGEHGVAIDRLGADARDNTSTTVVAWWERLAVAPNFVNFHLEHHLAAGVPAYNLARFHRTLRARGYYDDMPCLSFGYLDVVRKASARDPEPAGAGA